MLVGNDKTQKRCSRRIFLRRSCMLANNDKISYQRETHSITVL